MCVLCSNEQKMNNPHCIAATGVRTVLRVIVPFVMMLGLAGCQTAVPETTLVNPEAAIEALNRPLGGDPAALYRLRTSRSSGLRVSLLTKGDEGRLTVSEPLGGAVSLTSWSGSQPPTFFDLREGCRLETSDLERALGVAAMPLPQAVRLLGGRLPAASDDWVTPHEDGRILVEGRRWTALVRVAVDPYRVVSVEEVGAREKGWRFELGDHSLSVPGFIRVENPGGRWAELELVRLEWNVAGDLPPRPDLPPCVAAVE
jgi:hypothetical protein